MEAGNCLDTVKCLLQCCEWCFIDDYVPMSMCSLILPYSVIVWLHNASIHVS